MAGARRCLLAHPLLGPANPTPPPLLGRLARRRLLASPPNPRRTLVSTAGSSARRIRATRGSREILASSNAGYAPLLYHRLDPRTSSALVTSRPDHRPPRHPAVLCLTELCSARLCFRLLLGKICQYVTSRNLRDRLYRELERNLAMKVEDGETADTFLVSGRGTLHLTILIENMRREGYEFMIGPPKVINKTVDGKLLEPYEIAAVEVPEEYMGSVVELLGKRRGQMVDMEASGPEGTTLLKYKIPTRGLIGLRNAVLTASRGRAILNTIFDSYGPRAGDLSSRDQGSLVAFEDGSTTSYALLNAQERGLLFVSPGQDVYKGRIVGIHQRPGDLAINVCKKKAATNVRSNKETTVVLDEPLSYSLDDYIEYIQEDELVEVTPASIRMCKNPKVAKKNR